MMCCGGTCQEGAYWIDLKAPAPYPRIEAWIQPGFHWPGGMDGSVFPTCMKSIGRLRPPPKPAGLNKCSYDIVQRWIADSSRFPLISFQISTLYSSWGVMAALVSSGT